MSHFAKIQNGIVTEVIVAEQDFINSGAVGDPNKWIQSSYNSNIRGTYAGLGYLYIEELDIFVPPKPFESWSLDDNGNWVAPVSRPTEGNWIWNESEQRWDEDDIAILETE